MTLLPASTYGLNLSGSEFKLVTAFYDMADQFGRITASKAELRQLTNISLATLTRAFRKLEDLGILATTRHRKGRNYFDRNSYQLLRTANGEPFPVAPLSSTDSVWAAKAFAAEAPSLMVSDAAVAEVSPSLMDEQSTGGHVAEVVVTATSKPSSWEKEDLLRKSPLPEQGPVEEFSSANKTDDSNAPLVLKVSAATAFRTNPKSRVNIPRDARTRNLRPPSQWNVYDVAAEFCARINHLRPDLPPMMNAKKLSGALMKMRKDLGIGPAEELYLVDIFIAQNDGFGRSSLLRDPHLILGKFLNLFKTELDRARRYGAERLEESEEKSDRLLFPQKWEKFDREKREREVLEREQRRQEIEEDRARKEAEQREIADAQRLQAAFEAEHRMEDRAMRRVQSELERHQRLMEKVLEESSEEPVRSHLVGMSKAQQSAYWAEKLEMLRSIPLEC